MTRNFQAPWNKMLKITTALFLIALVMAANFSEGPGPIIAVALLIAGFLLFIRGYSVQPGAVVVHGLLWSKTYDLESLRSAEYTPFALAGSARTMGVGGFFSNLGYYRSGELGTFMVFVTNNENTVVLDFDGQVVVVSPDDPLEFVKTVREEYRRIHKM